MKKLLLRCFLVVAMTAGFALAAQAVPLINFDQTDALSPEGTLTYDGAGGALVGANVKFDVVQGYDTPLHAGEALTCTNCVLSFTTGLNQSEGPTVWKFSGGGSFVLNGTISGSGGTIASGSLLTGKITSASVTSNSASLIMDGFGTDDKNPDLLSYFGFDAGSVFEFSNTLISTGGATFGNDGSISADITAADLQDNLRAAVPEPGILGMFGLSLLGLALVLRRKRRY